MDWIYIHRTFVYCWYQCSSIIIGDSARRIRIIILTCIDTNRFESLRHPRSPLNGEIYPRHICKEDSSGRYIIDDGRLRARHARLATWHGGGMEEHDQKHGTVFWGWIRLSSILVLMQVYNSDPTSRISNFKIQRSELIRLRGNYTEQRSRCAYAQWHNVNLVQCIGLNFL